MELVIVDRSSRLNKIKSCAFLEHEYDLFECATNEIDFNKRFHTLLISECSCIDHLNLCDHCTQFLCYFDLLKAQQVKRRILEYV